MIRQQRNDNGDEDAVGAKLEVRKTWHAECVFTIAIKEPLQRRGCWLQQLSDIARCLFVFISPLFVFILWFIIVYAYLWVTINNSNQQNENINICIKWCYLLTQHALAVLFALVCCIAFSAACLCVVNDKFVAQYCELQKDSSLTEENRLEAYDHVVLRRHNHLLTANKWKIKCLWSHVVAQVVYSQLATQHVEHKR